MAATSSPLEQLPGTQAETLLADAVGRNFSATIEITQDAQPLNYATRFLDMTSPPNPTLWLELPHEPLSDCPVQLSVGGRVTVHFAAAKFSYQCEVTVLDNGASLPMSGGLAVQAISVTWPTAVCRIQRRQAYRYEIPASEQAAVLLWPNSGRGTVKFARTPRSAFRGRLVNISVEGMCVRLDARNRPILNTGDAIAANFCVDGAQTIEAEARVRRIATASAEAVDLGLEFTSMGPPPIGMKAKEKLSRWISEQERRMLRSGRLI
jgi:c-di-GMP-binding flagellar brake protein YcgR